MTNKKHRLGNKGTTSLKAAISWGQLRRRKKTRLKVKQVHSANKTLKSSVNPFLPTRCPLPSQRNRKKAEKSDDLDWEPWAGENNFDTDTRLICILHIVGNCFTICRQGIFGQCVYLFSSLGVSLSNPSFHRILCVYCFTASGLSFGQVGQRTRENGCCCSCCGQQINVGAVGLSSYLHIYSKI